MTNEDYEWLSQNLNLLGNVRASAEDHARLFSIYNSITGESKPITSCGRCVLNVKKRLKFEYEKQRSHN